MAARRRSSASKGRPALGRDLRLLAVAGVGVVAGVAAVGLGLRLVVGALFALLGLDPGSSAAWWATTLGLPVDVLRLVAFGGAQVLLAVGLRPRARLWAAAAAARLVPRWHRWWLRAPIRARRAVDGVAGVVLAVAIVALLVQPTLVAARLDRATTLERLANLVDGTASASIVGMVVGFARELVARPVGGVAPVSPEDFGRDLDADEIPLMDRWDGLLTDAVDGDPVLFAQVKAFLWVESGGRQFAVSPTGCAGLMQFCASTARTEPFGSIFGLGRVAACGCADCSVPREVAVALETDPSAVDRHRDTFPCDLTDARFDPERSIAAGVAYVRRLASDFDGHLALMYVGYNAGPTVARELSKALGEQDEITIDELRPLLYPTLRPYHGARAERRARALLDVHLPELLEAFERFSP